MTYLSGGRSKSILHFSIFMIVVVNFSGIILANPKQENPEKKNSFKIMLKNNHALDLDNGIIKKLVNETKWPAKYELFWDKKEGGILSCGNREPIMQILKGAKNIEEAKKIAYETNFRKGGVTHIIAKECSFAYIITGENKSVLLEIKEFNRKRAILEWQFYEAKAPVKKSENDAHPLYLVTGTFKNRKLPEAFDSEIVHCFTTPSSFDRTFSQRGNVSDFLADIGRYYKFCYVDESKNNGENFPWRHHASSKHYTKSKFPGKLDKILKKISEQTGLIFEEIPYDNENPKSINEPAVFTYDPTNGTVSVAGGVWRVKQ
jgi:hypothetical protein